MKTKQWYVIMYQEEVDRFKHGKSAERLIYEAIKSYSTNGKVDVSLSNREIASRASISYSTVNRHLPKLIELGYIKVVGNNGHIGGVINTYRVLLPETLIFSKVSQTATVSVATSTESVASVGIKSLKIKENEKQTSQEEQDKIWEALNLESTNEIAKQRRTR
jgi:predicted transcriptional regulator